MRSQYTWSERLLAVGLIILATSFIMLMTFARLMRERQLSDTAAKVMVLEELNKALKAELDKQEALSRETARELRRIHNLLPIKPESWDLKEPPDDRDAPPAGVRRP